MSNPYGIVEHIWNSHQNYLGKQSRELRDFDIATQMANLFCPGEFYYYVINSPTLTLDLAVNTESLLGILPEEFTLEKLMESVHPDDIPFMMKCEDIVAYFLKNCIPPEKMVRYKISYCLREKTAHRGYRLFLLQTITLQTTENGALLKVFGSHTDISHITTENNHRLSLIGLNGEPSYLGIDVFADTVLNEYQPFSLVDSVMSIPFTKRELEILQLLANGFNTEEIAEKLFISRNTVETHRRNMLNKTDARNTTELVADCIRMGYI